MPHFDIYHADNSIGLSVDAKILGEALARAGHTVRTIGIPYMLFVHSEAQNSLMYALPVAIPNSHCIFLESIFEHQSLNYYQSTIFVPNPECFVQRDFEKAKKIISFWHKTRMSQDILEKQYPLSTHNYIGFSSPVLSTDTQLDYNKFIHFRGKSSHRHTQEILNIWRNNPDWPKLYVQLYGPDCPIIINEWMNYKNIYVYFGQMPRHIYVSEISTGGVHLCLSCHEGFGHYINEARSIGALIATLDAAPMNELIKSDFGFLIKPTEKSSLNMGYSYKSSPDIIKNKVQEILSTPLNIRKELGMLSKERFLIEKVKFEDTIASISSLLQ